MLTQSIAVEAYRSPPQPVGSVANMTLGYQVSGVTVLGPQQASIATINVGSLVLLADTITALGTMQTALNSALAVMRNHGLIGP